jgi:S-formylglutathione hydrolase FrmB
MRRRWFATCVVGMVTAATLLLGSSAEARQTNSPTPARLVTIAIPSDGLIASKWLDYAGPPRANVLLPAGYNPHHRYPVLFLLNGLQTDYDWFAQWGFTTELSDLHFPGIVVMPEGGSGWYSDWWNNGERGEPSWETYDLADVIPTVLARYPILPQRQYHAIAGVSMGGLGSAYLGGRLPGFFGSVISLSGFVDPQLECEGTSQVTGCSSAGPYVTAAGMGLTSEAPLEGDYDLDPVLGPPLGFYATGHNPAALVTNVEQTRVFVSTGNGLPSSADLADPTALGAEGPADYALERAVIYPMSQEYARALEDAGVDFTYQVHNGGHLIPDFLNEVKAMVAWGVFEPVVADPAAWVNNTVATSGQLWGVHYRFAEPPTELVQFRQSGSALSISAAGSAVTITTSGGCVIHTPTPATISVPSHNCR